MGKGRERQTIYTESLPAFGDREYGYKTIPVMSISLGLEPECQKDLVWSIVWVLLQIGTIAGGVIMKLTIFLKLAHLLTCQKTSKGPL